MSNRICRNCKHEESRHTREVFDCGYISMVLTIGNIAQFCPCYTFVPDDNLEYLELKVKQKEAEKLSL